MKRSKCCKSSYMRLVETGETICDTCSECCQVTETGLSAIRTPIGVAVTQDSGGEEVWVVCDDGTVWTTRAGRPGWDQFKSIPGTETDGI